MDFVYFFSLLSFAVSFLAADATLQLICPLQTLYQLGASKSDTGNLIRVLPVGPTILAARFPYGETFPGRPTGRWSNGRLMIDYTAMALGLPLLNPYLDNKASFNNGVNFAVAGSTALNSSFFAMRGVIVPSFITPLSGQLSWFKTYLASICSTPTECDGKLRRALIFVGEIGGNDINYPLAQGKSLQEIQTYLPFINQAIINTTREIIQAGALQIVVPGNFPIGCFPFGLSALASNDSTSYDEFGCIRSLNNLVLNQNNNLKLAISSLRREFPDVVIIYSDYYNAFLSVLRGAPILGFDRENLLKACCGRAPFNPLSPQFCGNPGVPVCLNPRRYVHWDGIHLTQEANRRISEILMRDILLRIRCIR
ncbi:hypothetical protein BUALT_Bualt13G0090600 [Buddleja alternifolia]|uniref:Acetylajmalan esterase n=1 Tax=Buddleja alternifolia TaxID=168488 RepID=A0AAV6WT82_9LAMI|nr:hypothetical protein BUALT_Bualt13G0090600 [Buddleja alternifolia]